MHRSPLSVLVIAAAMAACSTRDATASTDPLAQDSTLATELAMAEAPRPASLPAACGVVAAPARPAAARVAQAEELAHRGYAAEALGDLQEARSLLRRASDLDGTNESVTYHLGRTSQALGDRPAAISAYCRFLSLAPTTTESAEARQRVDGLSRPEPNVATGSIRDTAPTRARPVAPARQAMRRRAPVAPRVAAAVAAVERSAVASSSERDAHATSTAAGSTHAPAAEQGSTASAPTLEGAAEGRVAAGEVVAAPGPAPTAGEPAGAARASGGGPSRAQRAGIGAAAGAIIGAVTGRSVKGALIGAAAGGMLGTATGGIRPAGRGIRP